MPLINVKLIEGVFTGAQKAEMIKSLTDAMVSIEGENMRSVTWVLVEDVMQLDPAATWAATSRRWHRRRRRSPAGGHWPRRTPTPTASTRPWLLPV